MEEQFKQSAYKERLALIYSSASSPSGYRRDLGMEDVYEFDAVFGRKHKLFKTVHITGTNGKGSACIKIASGLSLAGYRVGRFQSPHISSCRERFTINGEMISETDFVRCADEVLQKLEEHPQLKLKFSEKLFFVALAYFALKKVEVAVIQVSVGGKHDSTIVIEPVLSVVTSVSLDHMEMLGPTVEDIAREKSAIIKPKVPCVLGPKAEPREIFLTAAQQRESPVYQVGVQTEAQSFNDVNKRIARQALEVMRTSGEFSQLDEKHIKEGIEQNQPCRMEQVPSKLISRFLGQERVEQLEVVLDVAHNPGSLTALVEYYISRGQEVWGVCGLSKKKEHEQILHYLLSKLSSLHFVQSNHFKLVKAEQLTCLAQEIKMKDKACSAQLGLVNEGDIRATLWHVLKKAAEKEVGMTVLVFGSFFMMEEVRAVLGYEDVRDETEINYKANQLMK